MIEEEVVAEDLVDDVIKFVLSHDFVNQIESFRDSYCHEFITNADGNLGVGFPHSYHSIFQNYEQLIDQMMQEFSRDISYSVAEIYDCFKDVGKFIYV